MVFAGLCSMILTGGCGGFTGLGLATFDLSQDLANGNEDREVRRVLAHDRVAQLVEPAALDLVADRHRSESFERDDLLIGLDVIADLWPLLNACGGHSAPLD